MLALKLPWCSSSVSTKRCEWTACGNKGGGTFDKLNQCWSYNFISASGTTNILEIRDTNQLVDSQFYSLVVFLGPTKRKKTWMPVFTEMLSPKFGAIRLAQYGKVRVFVFISYNLNSSDNFNSNKYIFEKFQISEIISWNATIHGQVSLFFVFSSFNATKPNLSLSKRGSCRSFSASRVLKYLLMCGMNIRAAIHPGANCCSGFKIRCAFEARKERRHLI